MQILINLLISGLAVLISAYILPGVKVDGLFAAVVVAIVLGIVNATIKPLVSLLTLPLNVMTLGLFSLVITALMVFLTDWIVPGFAVSGFISALLFGLVLSFINGVLFNLMPDAKAE